MKVKVRRSRKERRGKRAIITARTTSNSRTTSTTRAISANRFALPVKVLSLILVLAMALYLFPMTSVFANDADNPADTTTEATIEDTQTQTDPADLPQEPQQDPTQDLQPIYDEQGADLSDPTAAPDPDELADPDASLAPQAEGQDPADPADPADDNLAATTENTLHVTYDSNYWPALPAPVDGNAYAAGDEVNVLFAPVPMAEQNGMTFIGWDTDPYLYGEVGTVFASYTQGGNCTFTITQDTTLYAVWGLDPNYATIGITPLAADDPAPLPANDTNNWANYWDNTTLSDALMGAQCITDSYIGQSQSGNNQLNYLYWNPYTKTLFLFIYTQDVKSNVISAVDVNGIPASIAFKQAGKNFYYEVFQVELPAGLAAELNLQVTYGDSAHNQPGVGNMLTVKGGALTKVKFCVTYDPGEQGTWLPGDEYYPGMDEGSATPLFGTNSGADVNTDHKPGYVFIGWEPAWSDTVTTDVTYVAIWAALTYPSVYTVTYEGYADGGIDVVDPNNPYAQGDTVKVQNNSWFRIGYTFTSWNTERDGYGQSYQPGEAFIMPDNDVTLYAQWKQDPYQTKEIFYTVEYYIEDNISASGLLDSVTVIQSVWINSPDTLDVQPIDTTRAMPIGYRFAYTIPQTVPTTVESGTVIQVIYVASDDTQYTVFHYNAQTAEALVIQYLTGTTNQVATAQPQTIDGYTYDPTDVREVLTGIIAGDGSLILALYYMPVEPDPIIPDPDPIITAAYTVIHYNAQTAQALVIQNLTGTIDTQATGQPQTIQGFTYDSTDVRQVLTGNIAADGSLILALYYTPDQQDTPVIPVIIPTPPTPPTPPAVIIPPVVITLPPPAGPVVIPAVAIPAPATATTPTPATITTPPAAPATTTVVEPAAPLAAPAIGHWALLNLILTILGILVALILLAMYLVNRKSEKENTQNQRYNTARNQAAYTSYDKSAKRLWPRIVSAVAAVVAIVLFILTEDMTLPMVFTDKWTIYHIVIIVILALFAIVAAVKVKSDEQKDNQAKVQNAALNQA